MSKLFNQILTKLQDNQNVYLLTVVQNSGSSPGRKGFKMFVSQDGFISGSIGGGIMEYKLIEEVKRLLQTKNLPIILKKQVHKGKVKDSSGMICSGEQTVVFHPLTKNNITIIKHIINCLDQNKSGVLTLTHDRFNFEEKEINENYSFTNTKEEWLYKETINYKDKIYIIGAGHVGLAVSKLLNALNYSVEIFDNREDLNTFNQNTFVVKKQIIDYKNVDDYVVANAYVLIMTTKFTSDQLVLSALLKSTKKFKYLGVLGSASKIETMFKSMVFKGFSKGDLQHIYAPIGLPINSETPEEIAISIVAQFIQLKNKK